MKLVDLIITANDSHIDPAFLIKVTFEFESEFKFLVRSSGHIKSNGKIISILQHSDLTQYSETFNAKSTNKNKRRYSTYFHGPLSKLALEKIENERLSKSRGDVILDVSLCFDFIEPTFEFARFAPDTKTDRSIVYSDNNSLFNYETFNENNKFYKISSSDWIHDYSPIFGLGVYKVFEFPELKVKTSNNQDYIELIDRMNGAIEAFSLMEEAMRDGDWTLVMKESRPVWELARCKDKISTLLQNEGLSEQAIGSFEDLIKSLFDFSSKFIHRVGKGNSIMINKAEKEDAILVHSLSLSIVNLLSKKINRII